MDRKEGAFMKLKKITSIIAIALTIVATSTTFGQGVYAAEKSTTSASTSVSKSNKIDSNTVITNNNIYDVLKYLNLNQSDLIKGNKTEKSVSTVGEFQKAIEQSKKQKITVETKAVPDKLRNDTTKSNNANIATYSDDDSPVDSQRVYRDLDETNYKVEFSCSGSYTHGQWCGVSGEDAELSNAGSSFYSYAITSKKDLSATFTSDRITMHHDIMVTGYVSLPGFSYPSTKVEIKGYDYFNIDDWV